MITAASVESSYNTIINPELFFADTTQRSATKYQVKFNVSGGPVAKSVKIGNIGIFLQAYDFGVAPPEFAIGSNDSTSMSSRGRKSVVSRPATVIATSGQRHAGLQQTASMIEKFGHFRGLSTQLPHFDFAQYPAALYFDELDDGTDAGTIATNNVSGQYLIDTSSTITYNFQGTHVSYPFSATAWR